MSLFKTGVVIALGVALMPSDAEQQERLYTRVAAAAHWTATFCDRNAATCENGAELWATFTRKAQFAGQLAYDVALRYSSESAPPEADQVSRTSVKLKPSSGTLKPDDLEPAWRGKPTAGGA